MRGASGQVLWHSSPEAEAAMADLCSRLPWNEVAAEMRDRFGVDLTRGQVRSFRSNRGIRCAATTGIGRFERGRPSPPKGRRREEWMSPEAIERCRATQFKPGCERGGIAARLWCPIGTERVRHDGYVWVKVAEGAKRDGHWNDNWRQRSHVVWEREHGPLPEGCVVVHVDGDRTNDKPSNLEVVPREMAMVLNRGPKWWDRESFEACLALAELRRAAARARRDGGRDGRG